MVYFASFILAAEIKIAHPGRAQSGPSGHWAVATTIWIRMRVDCHGHQDSKWPGYGKDDAAMRP